MDQAVIRSQSDLGVEMREYAIAAIPADGIGPEVIEAGLKVLQVLGQKVGGFQL